MARFLTLWRVNPAAPWPTDPSELLKLNEKIFAVVDDLIKKGEIEELGFFPETREGGSGYAIYKGEATDIARIVWMFDPYIFHFEVHEIIPWEKGKEIWRALYKAQIAAAKK